MRQSLLTTELAAAVIVVCTAISSHAAPPNLSIRLATAIDVTGEPGKMYALQAADALDGPIWEVLDSRSVGSNGSLGFVDLAGGPAQRFYRVVEVQIIEVNSAWNQELNTPFAYYRVTENLSRTGDGLRITANHVILDLNGHTLSGSGSGTAIQASGVSNALIQGGRIANFFAGILANNSTNVHIKALGITGLGATVVRNLGITATNATALHVESCEVTQTDNPILLFGVKDSEIDHCNIYANDKGIRLTSESSHNLIHHNTVTNQPRQNGIIIDTASHRNEVYANTCMFNLTGIYVDNSDSNLLRDNVSNLNGWGGLWVRRGQHNVVRNNTARRNGTTDFVKFGILLGLPRQYGGPLYASNTLVENNTALENEGNTPFKIDLFDTGIHERGVCENTWRNNVFLVDNEADPGKGPNAGCIQ